MANNISPTNHHGFRLMIFALFAVLISSLFLSSFVSASYITDTFNVDPQVSSTATTFAPSFLAQGAGTCFSQSQYKGSATGTGFSTANEFYSPNVTVFAVGSTLAGQNTYSCKLYADFNDTMNTATGTNGSLETGGRSTFTGGTNGLLFIDQKTTCSPTARISYVMGRRTDVRYSDDRGFIPNVFYNQTATYDSGLTQMILDSQSCSTSNSVSLPSYGTGLGCSGTVNCAAAMIIPFNSSYSGTVTLNTSFIVTCSNAGSNKIAKLYLGDSSGTTTVIDSLSGLTCGVGSTVNQFNITYSTSTLTPQSTYYIGYYIAKDSGGADSLSMTFADFFNLTIDTRQPEYQCTSYGTCSNGSQTRSCTDSSGFGFPNRVEQQTCFSPGTFQEPLDLGFEQINETHVSVYECQRDRWTCVHSPQLITPELDLPQDWKINFETATSSNVTIFHEAMAYMTSETPAFEGSYALRFNYRVPKGDVVDSGSPAVCANQSIGFQADVKTYNLNATISSRMFTFPTPYQTLTWAVKKAETPREQYPQTGLFDGNPFCTHDALCYGNCSATVSGRYKIRLDRVDANGTFQQSIIFFPDVASSNWTVKEIEINTSQVVAGALYRISIATDAPSFYDATPIALYFDAVKITSNIAPKILTCSTQCNGSNQIRATLLNNNGTCFLETIINETSCRTQFDQDQQTAATSQTNQDPIFGDLLSGSGVTAFLIANNLEFVTFLFSPIFIVIMIILGISGFIEYKIKTNGSAFGISVIALTLMFTSFGLLDVFVAVMMVVLGGAITMNMVVKAFRAGGGGD